MPEEKDDEENKELMILQCKLQILTYFRDLKEVSFRNNSGEIHEDTFELQTILQGQSLLAYLPKSFSH